MFMLHEIIKQLNDIDFAMSYIEGLAKSRSGNVVDRVYDVALASMNEKAGRLGRLLVRTSDVLGLVDEEYRGSL